MAQSSSSVENPTQENWTQEKQFSTSTEGTERNEEPHPFQVIATEKAMSFDPSGVECRRWQGIHGPYGYQWYRLLSKWYKECPEMSRKRAAYTAVARAQDEKGRQMLRAEGGHRASLGTPERCGLFILQSLKETK